MPGAGAPPCEADPVAPVGVAVVAPVAPGFDDPFEGSPACVPGVGEGGRGLPAGVGNASFCCAAVGGVPPPVAGAAGADVSPEPDPGDSDGEEL